jgi:AraC-like DNA-binding protein
VGNFLPSRIYLTRSYLPGSIHERILGAPVVYEATTAGFDVDKAMLDLPLASADPSLFQLLSEVSKKLGLGMTEGNLESLIRSRLRDLLPQGISSAYRVAQSFGLSERTFHRKLKEAGLTFQDVLDQFRMEESEKFLLEGKTDFATIALELGYSDQSGWSRFFRRMRGRTPKQWLKQVSKL